MFTSIKSFLVSFSCLDTTSYTILLYFLNFYFFLNHVGYLISYSFPLRKYFMKESIFHKLKILCCFRFFVSLYEIYKFSFTLYTQKFVLLFQSFFSKRYNLHILFRNVHLKCRGTQQKPKVKDVQVIADVIVSQATAMQPERENFLSDESSSNSLKTAQSFKKKKKKNYQRAYSLRSASPQSDTKPTPLKMASAEDLYTDIDKFTYTTDLSSLTAKVDIDSLTNQRKSDAKTKGKTKSVQFNDTIRNSLLQESDKLFSALGLTKQDISTLVIGDNNDGGDSLFDDPDLLKGLPPVATASVSPSAAISHHSEKKESGCDTAHCNIDAASPVETTCTNKDSDEKEFMKMMREFVANASNASNESESLESMKNSELDACKEKILHRRLVSESEYANLLRHLQKRDGEDTTTQQVHLSNTEKARINAAKEMFKHGRNSLLFMREQTHGKEYTRPARYDLKADVEHNKHINLLLQQTLAKVTTDYFLCVCVPPFEFFFFFFLLCLVHFGQ
ncbi:hypothetical protein RFI_17455 [Reticulomyxa filosa]|uniref:Uncharacterized protein n=1 Tax=Reticulomyxa filosa TaxID=46433 RepID=X6N202_RETFI|nr:hypothetical protein RFI_17455 [Reticulomyxa filosa]|eukprot:ETO19774.1 hypothetical protein RFI_17455 [Reticulomyxa filosa]